MKTSPARTEITGGAAASAGSEFRDLVARIHENNEDAAADLYAKVNRGLRLLLGRRLPSEVVEDKLQDVFVIVIQAIREGRIREPERLMGFFRTVAERAILEHIRTCISARSRQAENDAMDHVSDPTPDPEQNYYRQQQVALMREVLKDLSGRDREILTRFYVDEQTQQQICSEMRLTDTQFRLFKSRAKARFAELGKRQANGALRKVAAMIRIPPVSNVA